MRHSTLGFSFAGIAALILSACGGGGGPTVANPANTAPTANAGANQTVSAAATVTLNGTLSSDPDGTIASYSWTQTAGTPALTLTAGATSQPSFIAPQVLAATTFTFSLVVTDNRGAASTASSVSITVNPAAAGTTNVTGSVNFTRIPFSANLNLGLNYAASVQRPARGVVVRAVNAGTSTVLATGSTDDTGNYTLAVPNNTSINIVVVAQMLRDSSQPLPRWNFTASDGVGSATYSYADGAAFNSTTTPTHDVVIPSGFSSTGVATGTRASGPFAILDTVYQARALILTVAPTTTFPALVLDWGTQTDGTFFDGSITQRIALLSDATEDTDEFDQHVIAHEFGHYIEFNFSRADNIGGSHGLGDKLDARVAFGEGFGYAFAAIALNDPVARDSFVDAQCAPSNQCSSTFNVETNPVTNGPGTPAGNFGCWCSESSVWSILWDLADNVADSNDTLALGFQPIWDVLIGDEKVTPAFTTIFSFTKALKVARPGDSAAIDTLLAAQNITSVADAFATGESHTPSGIASATAALPLYTSITVGGGPVIAQSAGTADLNYNKLGNHRYLRLQHTGTPATLTITVATPGTDADFLVFRNGVFIRAAEGPPAASETTTINNATAGTYLIDVYECANGCTPAGQAGTPGNYNLTVTVN
jgi:hypothetical protein